MDDYTKRLVLCFSEKLDQAKVGYIEWNSFKLMAMVRTAFSYMSAYYYYVAYYIAQSRLLTKLTICRVVMFAESHFPAVWRHSQG